MLWRVDCNELIAWQADHVTSWLYDELTGILYENHPPLCPEVIMYQFRHLISNDYTWWMTEVTTDTIEGNEQPVVVGGIGNYADARSVASEFFY